MNSDDLFVLLNARNFAYYCDIVEQIKKNRCPFCDPMDLSKNHVAEVHGSWRMWPCPTGFRSKDLREHLLLAPVGTGSESHKTHIGDVTEDEIDDFCTLLHSHVLRNLDENEPVLVPTVGSPLPVPDSVYAECIVPNQTRRLEAVFSNPPKFDGHLEETVGLQYRNHWQLSSRPKKGCGVDSRFIIHSQSRSSRRLSDLSYLLGLCFYCGDETGLGMKGGAILMGLPGAALVMRFGPPMFHAGSVRHLHCNIMKPAPGKTVKVTLAKDPADIEAKKRVIAVWEKMRLFTEETPDMTEDEAIGRLSSEEASLVSSRK